MGKTRAITVVCHAPKSSCEKQIVDTIAQLVDQDVTFVNSDKKVSLERSVENTFTENKSTTTSISLTGCVRTLVQGTELWNQKDASQWGVESWTQFAETTLLPTTASTAPTDSFKQIVEDFIGKVEKQLSSQDKEKAYLADETVTAADIVICLLLAQAAKSNGITAWPEKTQKWGGNILQKLQKGVSAETIPFEECKEAYNPDVSSSTTAPAVVSAVAPATANETVDDKNAVLELLKEYGLEHTVYSHELAATAEELVEKVPLPSEKETHTKNLFLRDKKHGLFCVTVAANAKIITPVQTKNLGKLLGLKGKTNLRLADEKLLMQHLKCKPGSVGPLSIALDEKKEVTLVLDQALMNYEKIHSHPLRNDMSIALTPSTFKQYFEKCGVEPTMLEFSTESAGAPAAAQKAKPSAENKQGKGQKKEPKQGNQVAKKSQKKTAKKGDTLLALQWKKTEDFAQWYTNVIVLSEMISYYDISGCYILRPWSYRIWELMQVWFNAKILELGVENSYFPLFVSKDRLEKEKDHVEGFAPEVAWVTKSGDGDLAQPIAVRPTSETIMYPAFSDWIKSHRDLPLKLNQWSNVVRWEFKYPTPFLRSREFLWQEGHTAHATHKEADVMVMLALELYRGVYEDLLAVPVVKGYKTEKEKFAGGLQTTTVEAYIPGSGRAIQGATSHNLGQNFGEMFDIKFQDKDGVTKTVWQTSWGLTTRTIGVMVMVHGDDTGLVLPPRIAPLQCVIVPIFSKKFTLEEASPYCEAILKDLKSRGIRAKFDDRDMYNPGWKYNHWEQKGVPVRIEVGPRDMENGEARIVVRHSGEKVDLPVNGLADALNIKLEEIHVAMFKKAKEVRDSHLVQITDWKDFVPNIEKKNLVLTPWCGGEHQDWEEWVKTKSRDESLAAMGAEGEDEKTSTSVAAKTLCIPFKQPDLPEGTKCIASGLPATCWVLWGRSY